MKIIDLIKTKIKKLKLKNIKKKLKNKVKTLDVESFKQYVELPILKINDLDYNNKMEGLNVFRLNVNQNILEDSIDIQDLFLTYIGNLPYDSQHKDNLISYVTNEQYEDMFQYINDYVLYEDNELLNKITINDYNKPIINYLESIGIDYKTYISSYKGNCIIYKKYLDVNLCKFMNMGYNTNRHYKIILNINNYFSKLLELMLIKEYSIYLLQSYNTKLFTDFFNMQENLLETI